MKYRAKSKRSGIFNIFSIKFKTSQWIFYSDNYFQIAPKSCLKFWIAFNHLLLYPFLKILKQNRSANGCVLFKVGVRGPYQQLFSRFKDLSVSLLNLIERQLQAHSIETIQYKWGYPIFSWIRSRSVLNSFFYEWIILKCYWKSMSNLISNEICSRLSFSAEKNEYNW